MKEQDFLERPFADAGLFSQSLPSNIAGGQDPGGFGGTGRDRLRPSEPGLLLSAKAGDGGFHVWRDGCGKKNGLTVYGCAACRGSGPVSIRKLMEVAGSPKDALKLSETSLRAILGEKRAECVRRGRTAGQRDLAARRLENYRIRGDFFRATLG